jgi:HEAT repeat protein
VLAKIATDDAANAITDGLETSDPAAVFWAARFLAKLQAKTAVPALIRCLENRHAELDDEGVRSVIRALGLMPQRAAVPVLSAALRGRNRRTRKAAAWALVQIRAPESRAALESAAAELSWLSGRAIRRALAVKVERADEG